MRPVSIAPKDRIVLPLDVPDIPSAQILVDKLSPHVGPFKMGLELIFSIVAGMAAMLGDQALGTLQDFRKLMRTASPRRIFIDGKLSDIPNTVGKAASLISQIGVAWFNVHASSGTESIKAAVANRGSSKVLGVTVLTSINSDECVSIFGDKPDQKVLQFAAKLLEAGADGIICSPKELSILRQNTAFDQLMIVTPGVRPEWAATNDQKRIMTPGEAIAAGADYLVIGRPITAAEDPVAAAQKIAEEIRLAEFVQK